MGFEDSSHKIQAFFGAAGMTMDGDPGSELTNERLIPIKPRFLSLQESPPNMPVVRFAPIEKLEIGSAAVWKKIDDVLVTERTMGDEIYSSRDGREAGILHRIH